MQLKALFTDVYDGVEYPRTETLTLEMAPDVDDPTDDAVTEWAQDELRPRTGTGQPHDSSGYFVEILECKERPYLVGHEFTFGI